MLIHIIDNDQATCDALKEFIEDLGFECICSACKKTAIEVWSVKKPSIIIIDQYLSDGLGTDLIPLIRDKWEHTVKIICVTARPGKMEFINKFRPDSFIFKPFDLEHLENVFI